MPSTLHDRENATPEPASRTGGNGRGLCVCVLLAICLFLSLAPSASAASKLTLQTSGGIAIAGAAGVYTSSFGTMNALALGTAQAGVSKSVLTNGAMYFSTLGVSVSSLGNPDTAVVKAYVSTNFTGAAASAMVIYGCPSTSACNSAGQFSTLGTSLGTEATLAAGITKNANTATIGLAIFLPDNDGASAFTGTVAAGPTVTFDLYVNGAVITTDVATLALNNSTVQNAVQLTLGTATGGLTITPSAPLQDPFSMNFGNVNGLGIGPATGLTTFSQAGGMIYSTPYNVLPIFTDMSSTAASIKVCVSTTFTHSAVLGLHDSASGSSGSFSSISTNCGTATSLTSSAVDRSTITRYLGLFVSNVNGATAYTGVDNATLTYTLTVP